MVTLIIDSVDYTGSILPDEIVVSTQLVEGLAERRLMNGAKWFDIIGREKTYTVKLYRSANESRADWIAFYETITAPVSEHTVNIGGNVFKCIIRTVEARIADYVGGQLIYDDCYTVTFEPTELISEVSA